MMEFTARIVGVDIDIITHKTKITFEVENRQKALDAVEMFKDKLILALKKFTKARSLNANDYSWVLTDKLSDAMVVRGLKLSKDEMHAEMIFRYGQKLKDSNGADVVYSTSQEVNMPEFYPYAKEIGKGTVNGKTFKHYKLYRGSHTYNTEEFNIFLQGIILECQEQGIPTETPDEIANMMSRWDNYYAKHIAKG